MACTADYRGSWQGWWTGACTDLYPKCINQVCTAARDDKTVRLLSDHGYCMNVMGGNVASQSIIWLWNCEVGSSDQFYYSPTDYTIRPVSNSGLCFNVRGGPDQIKAGTGIWLYHCNPHADDFQFVIDRTDHSIRVKKDRSFCLHVGGGHITTGSHIQLGRCDPTRVEFQFDFLREPPEDALWVGFVPSPPLSDKTIRLRADSSLCLDVKGGHMSQGSLIQLWSCYQVARQGQTFYYDSQTSQVRSASHPHLCLNVQGGPNHFRSGTPIILWDCYGTREFQFDYYQSDHTIRLKANTNLCFNVHGGPAEFEHGAGIVLWDCNADQTDFQFDPRSNWVTVS